MMSLIAWVEARHRLLERDFDTQIMLLKLLRSALPGCNPDLRHQFFRSLRGDLMGAVEFFHAVLPGWNYMLESNDAAPLCRINNPASRGKPFFASHTSTVPGTRGCIAFAMILATLRASLFDMQSRLPVASTAAHLSTVPALINQAEQGPATAATAPELLPVDIAPAGPSIELPTAVAGSASKAVEPAIAIPTQNAIADATATRPIVFPVRSEVVQVPRGDYQPNALDELATIEHMMADRFPDVFKKVAEHA
ncbi:hypothetical protein [Bosea sp. RAC05]|uniref:hypothetical protein n=1 Tax=Bosea sp. RAC05 TaxID=1842539 RepID=UPI0012379069|nr:hypothetical protein [Bosea sp. RAC05]